MIRDDEIKRLEQYAYGLGIKKIHYKGPSGDATGAEWVIDKNNEIELVFYVHTRLSKRMLILNFIHELGHHMSWIYRDKKEDPQVLEALNAEFSRGPTDAPLPKEQRKLIYQMEKADCDYRETIWNEVGIKMPKWRLYADIECDIWYYHRYYIIGEFPTYKKTKAKYYKIQNKWRKDQQ